MIVYHAAFTAAPDSLEGQAVHRHAHVERLLLLRTLGMVVGGGAAPDGHTADVFYRVTEPGLIVPLIQEDPYYANGVWTGHRLRAFAQFVEPWELPPVVTDGSRRVTLAGGEATDPEMATIVLIELRGAGRLSFGGFFEGGQTLGLFRTEEPEEALGWLRETSFWKPESLTARPLVWVL